MKKIVIKKSVSEEIERKLKEINKETCNCCDDVEKAGVPIGTISGNYKKVADNPSKWEWIVKKNNVETNTNRRIRIANTAQLIQGIKNLNVTKQNFLQIGTNYLNKMQSEINSRKVVCKVSGKQITKIEKKHIYIQRHSIKEQIKRTEVLPFVLPIIEKYGKKGKFEENKKGDYREIVGRAEISKKGKKQNVGISVIVADNKKGGQTIKFISVFVVESRLIKSFPTSVFADTCHTSGGNQSYRSDNDFQSPASNLNIPYRKKMSSEKLKQLQKSLGLDDIQFQTYLFSKENHKNDTFAVVITDITENNKEKKVEQLQKSLNCVDRQQPFSVRHIKSDILSQRYDDITLVISNFNKDKIDKAVHTVSFALDVKPKSKHKGEQFFYKAQENLTDEIILECFEKVKKMYLFVLNYFALPDVRIVAKADLKYKGKIIYNPETGEPIKLSEWKSFIKALQTFIDKEFRLLGRKIALKGQVLGRMLQRLSKRYSLSKLKKVELKDLEIENKKIDWISENTKNIKDVFGESIDRKTQAKIETANLSATQKIQQITDNEQNKIKNILIDGIKNKESKSKISQKLFDSCVGMNRDFQRIVDTELQNNTNSAYIHEEVYNAKEGERIYFKRSETVDDVTCKKCKKLKDTVVIYSPIPLDDENVKDEFAKYAIWDGKDGSEWKAPMGTMHPYCRGFWYRYYPLEKS